MARPPVHSIFLKSSYDLSKQLDVIRLMGIVRDSIGEIRRRTARADQVFCDEFGDFVNDDNIWPLIRMIIPEFRVSIDQQETDLDVPNNRSVRYVLRFLHEERRLPQPQRTTHFLSAEHTLMQDRQLRNAEYIMTGGQGRDRASPEELQAAVALASSVDLMRQGTATGQLILHQAPKAQGKSPTIGGSREEAARNQVGGQRQMAPQGQAATPATTQGFGGDSSRKRHSSASTSGAQKQPQTPGAAQHSRHASSTSKAAHSPVMSSPLGPPGDGGPQRPRRATMSTQLMTTRAPSGEGQLGRVGQHPMGLPQSTSSPSGLAGGIEQRRPSHASGMQQGTLAQGVELPHRARSSSRPREWARTGVVRGTPEFTGSSSPSSPDSMISRPVVLDPHNTPGSRGPSAATTGLRQVPGTQMEVPETQVAAPRPQMTATGPSSPRMTSTSRHYRYFCPSGTYNANAITTWLQDETQGGEILIQIPREAPRPPGLFPDDWARDLTLHVQLVRERVAATYRSDEDLRRRADRFCNKAREYLDVYEARRSRRRQGEH